MNIVNTFGTTSVLDFSNWLKSFSKYKFNKFSYAEIIKVAFKIKPTIKLKDIPDIDIIKKKSWDKYFPDRVEGLEPFCNILSRQELNDMKDTLFESIISIILANACRPNVKNLIWAEGIWLSEICKFLFNKLNISYDISETGPFKNTFLWSKKGFFLVDNIDFDISNFFFKEEDFIKKILEKESSFDLITQRHNIVIKKEPDIIKNNYILFLPPYYKWVYWSSNKWNNLKEFVSYVIDIFNQSTVSKTNILLIKLHPIDKMLGKEFKLQEQDNIKFVDPYFSTKLLIQNSNFVITKQSKTIYETIMNFKKVINIGQLPFNLETAIYKVFNKNELLKTLNEIQFYPLNKWKTLKFLYYLWENMVVEFNDYDKICLKLDSKNYISSNEQFVCKDLFWEYLI